MKTWILAVSGGVDSVVMLDKMSRESGRRYVIAHVDHGIRPESAQDAEFVEQLAKQHGYSYESIRLELGTDASEETARTARWSFLRSIQQKYNAEAIVTGHHADDVVETIIINLTRGTGWRGLVSLREHEQLKRPLIAMRKSDILWYATRHNLAWREDATNTDESYLRNHVRRQIIPKCTKEMFDAFLDLYHETLVLQREIDDEIINIMPQELTRYEYIMWPDEVAREVLRASVGSLTSVEMNSVLHFIRTARPHKTKQISGRLKLKTTVKQFIVIRGDS